MRKVTNEIANAFAQGESKAVGNTWTDGQAVYLHGSLSGARGFEVGKDAYKQTKRPTGALTRH